MVKSPGFRSALLGALLLAGATASGCSSGNASQGSGGTTSVGGSSSSTIGTGEGVGGERAVGGTVGPGGATGNGGQTGAGGGSGSGGSACLGAGFMGQDTVLVGASMTDATAAAAPFDARYLYICGGLPASGDCAACSAACNYWWGCWQDYAQAPGQYALALINSTEGAKWQSQARPQIPVFTYYQELQGSKLAEGSTQVSALNDAAFMSRYLGDWRLLLRTIGQHRAMLHIEPDLWGYVRNVNSNPHSVPAKVKTGDATECATEEDSASGFALCMIHMVRKYAPNAKVGLHASAWLIGQAGDGAATGNFMNALGAADGDFVVTDPSDRDAGYYQSQAKNTWWDDTKAEAYLAWSKSVAETVGKPIMLWQIPVGNMSQNNTTDHWQDNRVDWLFAHMIDVASAHVVGLLFGAGADGMTTPETDGGNLIAKTTSYRQAGGTNICQ